MACKPRILVEPKDTDASLSTATNTTISLGGDDDDYIDIELFNKIKEVLQCPVCFDIFKHPVNVKPCLHKFCTECIEVYNRKIKKECPGCRQ